MTREMKTWTTKAWEKDRTEKEQATIKTVKAVAEKWIENYSEIPATRNFCNARLAWLNAVQDFDVFINKAGGSIRWTFTGGENDKHCIAADVCYLGDKLKHLLTVYITLTYYTTAAGDRDYIIDCCIM